MTNRTKICSTCGLEKNISEFYENAGNKDGYSNICKECQKEYSAKWSEENRERKNQLARERYLKRKQEFAELKKLVEENGLNQRNN